MGELMLDSGILRNSKMQELENNLDFVSGIISGRQYGRDTVISILDRIQPDLLLRITDFLLHKSGNYNSPSRGRLSALLDQGRSKWTVGILPRGTFGLSARVPQGVQEAAESLFAAGAAGGLLAQAWGEVHDFHPADSSAYASAVKAVETAGLVALGITNENATLGNVIRAIEAKDSRWSLPFRREHTDHPSREVLLGLLKSLWRGHRDRHGSAAYEGVTHDEALAAVTLAVTLVALFSAGLVKEIEPDIH